MSGFRIIVFVAFLSGVRISFGHPEKLNLDALNNYSEFLNFGEKKFHKTKSVNGLENAIFKSKLDVLGEVFKKNVDIFKASDKLDIVFLVDASSSVGDYNFKSELKFIKKLLSDITVDFNHTRVAVVTFSSPSDTFNNTLYILDKNIEALAEITVRLMEIECQVNLMENKIYRKVILDRRKNAIASNRESSICIISAPRTGDSYIEVLTQVKNLYPDAFISLEADLSRKMECAEQNETILVTPDQYVLKMKQIVIGNCSVKGVGDRDQIALTLLENAMFHIVNDYKCDVFDNTLIENITFNCKNANRCAFQVKLGHLEIKNCKFIGNPASTTQEGIVVFDGAKVSLINCELVEFSIGIVGHTGSEIELYDTVIHSGHSGIKIFDGCNAKISNSTIKDCKGFGIILETENEELADVSSFEALDLTSNITLQNVEASNIQRGHIFVKNTKLDGIENLFQDSNNGLAIIEISSEESD